MFDFFDPGFGYPYGQAHKLKEDCNMIGPMYKTGGEIFDALQLVKKELGIECRPAGSSLKTGETYRDKTYAFSWSISKKVEFIYIIKDLDTDKKKEEKDMTKEEALKKIEELKEFIKKCDEEIPKMNRAPLPDEQPAIVCQWKTGYSKPLWWDDVTSWLTFAREDTRHSWGILAYELAQLMYAREYLKVDGEKLLRARKQGHMVFKVIFDVTECVYVTINVFCSQTIDENERIWCFKDEQDANRVRDYLNKYVVPVKKNMF